MTYDGKLKVSTNGSLTQSRANQIKTGVYKVKGYNGVVEIVYY
jgi:hypothetical protein